ncbi:MULTISPECIES: class I SAM-dependent methyltransferase [Niastella]|uniref:Methyltransferase domain-containing protein n=1 Tax=Niastella soli TaxID=2821487 RepID=A0ABS3Z089_9BACT|nr:methyltransferase domain-containing protein [Niastella soli]MBO9203499.1 methyltransferase domain-containing protein [Niastella soli]
MYLEQTGPKSINRWLSTDAQFNKLYPKSIQILAAKHWTPLHITQLVAPFLVTHPGIKVLDIGSGVGKFCLAGACYKSHATFYGVEQRKNLVDQAEKAAGKLGVQNVHFIHSNITDLDFRQYDHFYFFNSFYENLMDKDKIDDNITYSTYLYNYYHNQLYKKLNGMPAGTRIATFHCLDNTIPPSYQLIDEKDGTLLKFWIKVL